MLHHVTAASIEYKIYIFSEQPGQYFLKTFASSDPPSVHKLIYFVGSRGNNL